MIDISDPDSMFEVGSCTRNYTIAFDIDKEGEYAFVADCSYGLTVVDVMDPTTPQVVGGLQLQGIATGVHVDGSLAYLSAREAGLRVLDIANPLQPVEVGYHDTPGYAYDVFFDPPYIYVAADTAGLLIYEYLGTAVEEISPVDLTPSFHLQQSIITGNYIQLVVENLAISDLGFRLYDITGRLRYEFFKDDIVVNSNHIKLHADELSPGVYFLAMIKDAEFLQGVKLLKVK